MKLLTKLKLSLEGIIKEVSLDWREVAIEVSNDLLEERKRLDWYKEHDVKKYLKEIAKLWRKYEDQLDGRII